MGTPDETKYGTLSSEHAIKKAKAAGLEVIFPAPNQLQIDIDSVDALKTMGEMLPILTQHMKVTEVVMAPSNGKNHWHVTMTLDDGMTDERRILLQAVLGSDRKRELLSFARMLVQDQHPTLFVEKPRAPAPTSKA